MKKIYLLLVFAFSFGLYSNAQTTVSDSMNRYTEDEVVKLSNFVYELEKKDSLASATEPNGFGLKDTSNISDQALLVDLKFDSIIAYTDADVIKLSNYIYKNENGLTFSKKSTDWGIDEPSYSHGATYADLDNDGDLDLVVNNVSQTAFVYENQANSLLKNNFLKKVILTG